MAPPQVLEGTWEELSVHAATFSGKKLRLVIVEDDDALTYNPEEIRIAAIRAGVGKFADPSLKTLASEDLRQERQQDDRRFEMQQGSSPQ